MPKGVIEITLVCGEISQMPEHELLCYFKSDRFKKKKRKKKSKYLFRHVQLNILLYGAF